MREVCCLSKRKITDPENNVYSSSLIHSFTQSFLLSIFLSSFLSFSFLSFLIRFCLRSVLIVIIDISNLI